MKHAEADVERVAAELLEIYANRSLAKGYSFLPFPKEEKAFRSDFPYIHTPDQEQAISEILSDMSAIEPMDRLLS
jgi:transcription-repair coupling factor (superfamily II helicase)